MPNSLEGFLDALAARDFRRLAACMAPDAHARLLMPDEVEECSGGQQIASRFEGWFESCAQFQVVTTEHAEVGSRHLLRWRLRVVRDGQPWEVIEQVAFVDVGHEGIKDLDLLCSGFLFEAASTPGRLHTFEAGGMGCADGLAQEFRRRIAAVAVGDSLAVVVSDPAAKEDLPALARMLGQSITSVEAHDDGRLTINVERRR
jgi:TusA-related sulfurtransferase